MYFVAIFKYISIEAGHEILTISAVDVPETQAEAIVDVTNERLGLKRMDDGYGWLCNPGQLVAMYDHMDELPAEHRQAA